MNLPTPSTRTRIRPAQAADVDAMFHVRGATRENAISRARLAELGITPASFTAALAEPHFRAWVADDAGQVVGFAAADAASGEIAVVAVLAGYEGQGIGAALLHTAINFLHSHACPRLWLMAGADPQRRSHGFYRRHGWHPTGQTDAYGDEELVYHGAGANPAKVRTTPYP